MEKVRMTYYKYNCPNGTHLFTVMDDTETCVYCWVDDHPPKSNAHWWVTNHDAAPDNKKVSGPYTTSADAGKAREAIERMKPESNINYWIEAIPS